MTSVLHTSRQRRVSNKFEARLWRDGLSDDAPSPCCCAPLSADCFAIACRAMGGGLSSDGQRWVACRKGFLVSVKVLSRLFRRLLKLADPDAFATYLAPLRKINWVVYAKQPFGGPEAVLAYLSRYTHPLPGRALRSNVPRGDSDLKSPPDERRCRRSNLQMERQPDQIWRQDEGHAPVHVRVHTSFPYPCPTLRLPPHPTHRLPCEWRSARQDRDDQEIASRRPGC